MHPEMTGVLVNKINPLSDAHRVLKKDDIILAFDGVPIANDGTGWLSLFYLIKFSPFQTKSYCWRISFVLGNDFCGMRI